MSSLYSRGKSRIKHAKYSYSQLANDDAALSCGCFDIQQAIEYLLKYLFECNNRTYPKTHDVGVLLVGLQNLGICPGVLSRLRVKADMYTDWEAKSRYYDNFVATANEFSEAIELADELLRYVEENYLFTSQVSDEAYKWCYENAPEAVKALSTGEMLNMMLPLYQQYKDFNK